jgi:hypothetical protein
MAATWLRHVSKLLASIALIGAAGTAQAGQDLGKKACAHEARGLCPAEMRSLSRKRVETCMIARIDQTSAICHSAMLRIRAEREAAGKH